MDVGEPRDVHNAAANTADDRPKDNLVDVAASNHRPFEVAVADDEAGDAHEPAAGQHKVKVQKKDALVPRNDQVVDIAHYDRSEHAGDFRPRVGVLARQREGEAHQGADGHEEKGDFWGGQGGFRRGKVAFEAYFTHR